MPKNTIQEHKETLDNLLEMLKREKMYVEKKQNDLARQEKDYLEYLNQYQRAVSAKLTSFDRSKYLK